MTTTPGCGAGIGAIFTAGICVPCWVIGVVVIGGVIAVTQLFDEGDESCNCQPPPPPTPPPPIPPPPVLTNYFCVHNARGSQCPIDRVSLNGSVWIFDAHDNQVPPNFPPNEVYMNPTLMSWPEGANPIFADGSTSTGSYIMCTPVWLYEGGVPTWQTDAGLISVVIHFNNGESLDLGPQWLDYGTTFVVSWDDINGPQLVNLIP